LRRPADFDRICPDRVGDVLELGRAKIAHCEIEPRLHLTVGVFRQTDRAGLGDTFQARGNIDAVTHEIAIALLDHIAEMDADAELMPQPGWPGSLAEGALHIASALSPDARPIIQPRRG
jgi:hypothetical protein